MYCRRCGLRIFGWVRGARGRIPAVFFDPALSTWPSKRTASKLFSPKKQRNLAAQRFRCLEGCVENGPTARETYRRVGVSALTPLRLAVGTRFRRYATTTSDGDVRCSASTVDALRRVRRGTSTERAKVKIAEANRKGPQHRKRRTARRPEALYPSFPRSCAGVHDLWTSHAGRAGARPYQPHARPRRHVSPVPAQRFWLIWRMSIGFRFGYVRRVICLLTQTHVRSDSTL